jgi:hypothetical protein
MSFTVPLPPRTQLYHRSCSNKHTHTGKGERKKSINQPFIVLAETKIATDIYLFGFSTLLKRRAKKERGKRRGGTRGKMWKITL